MNRFYLLFDLNLVKFIISFVSQIRISYFYADFGVSLLDEVEIHEDVGLGWTFISGLEFSKFVDWVVHEYNQLF